MDEETRAETAGTRTWIAFSLVVSLLAAGLAVLVVVLHRRNLALAHELAAVQVQIATRAGIQVGERVEDLTLLDGSRLRLAGADRATLVIAVSHTCGTCKASLPVWGAIADGLRGSPVEVVLVDVDAREASEAIEAPAPLTPRLVRDGERTWLKRLSVVPAGLLLDREGVVVKAWWGELAPGSAGTTLAEIQGEAARLAR